MLIIIRYIRKLWCIDPRKIALITGLTVICITSSAQKSNDSLRFTVGFHYSYDSSYASHPYPRWDTLLRAERGYSMGVFISYNFWHNFVFETGLAYRIHRYRTDTHDLSLMFPIMGYYKYVFQAIDVPLLIKFSLGGKHVRWTIGAGMEYNDYFKGTGTRYYAQEGSPGREENVSRSNTCSAIYTTGLMVIYKKFSFKVEPYYRSQDIFGMKSPSTPNEYFYSYGVRISAGYRF